MESPIDTYLRRLHAEVQQVRDGVPYPVAPAGTTIDPDDFGICLATVDGYVYEVGTTRKEFSLQSLSKPLTYGLALSDLGAEAVDAKVSVEPSGDSFTEISLAEGSGRPANAMINAGALAVASLIKGSGGRSASRRITELYSDFAGRRLRSDKRVFAAERRNSDHNHALAYLLSSFGIIETHPTTALETYLRQCAVQVTCRDLAIMAATLANGGTNPVTGVAAMAGEAVERVLSVMMTSGMYDAAGDWVVTVGMPAKSGVGGGTLAVLPGQAGVAVYSPPLDEHGSSVRGVATCRRLSHDAEMHFVRSAGGGRSAIRATYPIAQVPSPIRRTEEAAAALRETGDRAVVVEIGGDLLFAGTESMIREITGIPDSADLVVLDLRRVDEVSRVAKDMINAVVDQFVDAGRGLVMIDPDERVSGSLDADLVPTFTTVDAAVAYCEDQLLRRYAPGLEKSGAVDVVDSPALAHLSREDAAALASRMEPKSFADGDVVRRVGQRFGGIYFIVSGRVTTLAPDVDGNRVTLRTLGAGMTFGLLGPGIHSRQETTEKADGAVQLMVLTDEAIDRLEREEPRLAIELWQGLTRAAYLHVDQYLRDIAARMRD